MRFSKWSLRFALPTFGAVLAISIWRNADLTGDFGDELYFAWQLSRGRVFGRDLVYTLGPLSPWINALWMKLFGPSLNVILAANLAVLILVAALLYRLLLEAFDEVAAAAAVAFFLPVFALGSATYGFSYNFLTPYSHSITHGLLICLAMIHCLLAFHRGGRLRCLIGGGLLTGLAFLTKPETFLACAATFAMGTAATLWLRRQRLRPMQLCMILLALIAAPLASWLVMLEQMPLKLATNAALSGWGYLLHGPVASNRFYRRMMGLDYPGPRLARLAISAAVDGAGLAIMTLGTRLLPAATARAGIVGGAVTFLAVLLLGILLPGYWFITDLALVLFALGAVMVTGREILGRSPDNQIASRRLAQWCLAVLSLSLLAKMPLNTRTTQYGFVLAAPAGTLAAAALIGAFPSLARRWGAKPMLVRSASLGLLAGLIVNRLLLTNMLIGQRTLTVPLIYGGSFHAMPAEEPAAEAVTWLRRLPDDPTVAVLPDGSGILFAAGKSNGIAYGVTNPVNLDLWGQAAPLQSLQTHPPDIILITRMDFSEMGARWFGQNYGVGMMAWIAHQYRLDRTFGQPGAASSVQVWRQAAAP
jgi:4-amino-4-deoxy-L-arabinose transferase-like glycosyltransferase